MVATATPAVCRNFRRDQPASALFLACAMTGTPLLAKLCWDALEKPILTPGPFAGLIEIEPAVAYRAR